MQLLTAQRSLLVPTLVLVALAYLSGPTAAHPPHEPDHGVNQTTACRLWAGDVDVTNQTELEARVEEDDPDICTLAPGTDVPLDEPPQAVERWNRGEHNRFPSTGGDISVYPRHADLESGQFIQDAHATIFAVQPSTRAHLSPDEKPHYVEPNGTLLGTVDYRVDVPDNDSEGYYREFWILGDHEIRNTRLGIDGSITQITTGSHTPAFDYDLSADSRDRHTIALLADIRITLTRRVEQCTYELNETCQRWSIRHESLNETITVRDSIEVTDYDLTIAGYRATLPNGDLGIVLYKTHPWLGYSLPTGHVRGVWRFYSARDERWDSLVTSSETGRSVDHSPLHPLQVHAYPFEPGPTPDPAWTVELTEVYGTSKSSPSLPEDVNLDAIQGSYLASYGIVSRTVTEEHDLDAVEAKGLVRGVTVDVDTSTVLDIQVKRSNLSVAILNRSANSVTVNVRLRNAESGAPINTDSRDGFVLVQGQRFNTTGNGTVQATVPRRIGGVIARYQPESWWRTQHAYVGDTALASLYSVELLIISILFELAVPVSLFLLAVYMIDRITGWRIWPPWRAIP